ncbi:MAG: fumarate reductase subunit FrdD [bacterium]
MTKSTEPFWWSLFAAGGAVAAFLVPVQILLTGIAAPLAWTPEAFAYTRILALATHPLTKLYLFVLIAFPMFHWAHRFRFTLVDLGLKGGRRLVAAACYGTAIVVMTLTAIVLIRL